MNTRFIIIMAALVLCLTGCIAGPTPHPGTENATDQLGPPAQPVPTDEAAEQCTATGGKWNGVSCDETTRPPEDFSDAIVSNEDTSGPDESDVPDDAMDGDAAGDDAVDVGPDAVDAMPDAVDAEPGAG